MYQHPFTLLQIRVTDVESKQVWSPMWLIAIGSRRNQLTCLDIYQAYRQRFDLEHLWRFGKQRLLMAAFQTPEVKHEENWVQLTLLAYTQLWVARELSQHLPRPWERYLPTNLKARITPSVVQRDFSRIIAQIGTPAVSPKPRGYSQGRNKGCSLPPRPKQKVLKKSQKPEKKLPSSA
jgi:hypothetical protein